MPSNPSSDLPFIEHDHHRRIVADELDVLNGHADVIGVFLSGSLARGDALPGSDVDIGVVAKQADVPWERGAGWDIIDGILVERGWTTPKRARERIRKESKFLYGYLDARILHDPDGVVANLVEHARKCFRGNTPKPGVWWYWLQSLEGKIRAGLDAGDIFAAVTALDAYKIVEGIWYANDVPFPVAFGAAMARLEELAGPPDRRALVEQMYLGTPKERIDAALDLLAWILPRAEAIETS